MTETNAQKLSELEEITFIAAKDILHVVDYDAVSEDVANVTISVENLFNFIPAGVNIGLGIAADDGWGILQSWKTGSLAPFYPGGGIYTAVTFDPVADNNHTAYGIQATIRPTMTSPPVGGYPTSELMAVRGYAFNYGANNELNQLFGGSFEARQYGSDIGEIYGIMVQATNRSSVSGNTTRLTGVYADAYTSIDEGAVAVGELYGMELRTFGKTNVAGAESAITTAYGLFSSVYNQQKPDSTSTIGNLYNVYLTPYRPGGYAPNEDGAITNYYGLFIVDPVDLNATNKWSIYSEGRVHFDQPTDNAAVPVLTLDQADISEGFIDFLGATAASAAGPISSWTTGATIQGFVRVEINGVGRWMAFYDAPTS